MARARADPRPGCSAPGSSLGDPFVAVPADDLERIEQAANSARSATRALAHGAHVDQLAAMLDEADRGDAGTIDVIAAGCEAAARRRAAGKPTSAPLFAGRSTCESSV